MIEQRVSSSSTSSHASRPPWLTGLLVFLLLLLGLVIYKGVTLSWTAWKTYQSAMQLRALAATVALDNPMALQSSLQRLADDFHQLAREVEPLLPVIERFGFVPTYGPLVAASPEVLDAGQQAFDLAQDATDLVLPALMELRASQPDAPATDLYLQAVAKVAPELPNLEPEISALRATLAAVNSTGVPERFATPIRAAPDLLAFAEVATQLGPELPALLGMERPQTYLVLVQNNHELRATGGFIAAIGRLTVDKGRLVELDFVDSYAIYRSGGEYPPAPSAMQRYMSIPLLVMRDANWSPDFPTAAQVARALYKSDTGIEVDGIVTVDLNAVKRIFGALGEIWVSGFDAPITGENIEEQIVQLWERPAESDTAVGGDTPQELGEWWSQRKEFIPRLAGAALASMQVGDADYLALGSALAQTLRERSIQIWFANPGVASVLSERGWDGALRPEAGSDFVAVVDTNMGYNKADAAIQRSLAYAVTWPQGADQPAQATLTLTYTHPIDAEDPGCDLTPRYGNSYADLVARCYFDYIRVFVPAGSKLVEATGVQPDSISTQRGEHRTQVFTGYFILPPRNTNVVTFTYILPFDLVPATYRLIVQRQSGTQPLPTAIEIDGELKSVKIDGSIWEWPLLTGE